MDEVEIKKGIPPCFGGHQELNHIKNWPIWRGKMVNHIRSDKRI